MELSLLQDSGFILAFCFYLYADLFIFILLCFISLCKLPQYVFCKKVACI